MSAPKKCRRLLPGELDGLVLAYLRHHREDGLTATLTGRRRGGPGVASHA
jgi:hypothetical protein